MSHFDRAFDDLMDREGGFTIDHGGKTRYGITEKTARRYGYLDEMEFLPIETAKEMYRKYYWDKSFDQFSYPVAFQVFDAAVNSGPRTAAVWLQMVAGAKADGVIGPKTIAAVNKMSDVELVLLFNAKRLDFITYLSNWPDAGKGWARRIVKNMSMVV
jgi:lysozyme family protein